MLVAGYSAYPRRINFAIMREIADEVGATLLVDMAHFAGLVAGKVLTGDFDPVPHAHVVTTTTHKTLRGPRGGMVLCQQEYADAVDRGCPMVLGGPLAHVMAAKAVALAEARQPAFREYAAAGRRQRPGAGRRPAAAAARALVSGGTDNHLVLVDVSGYGLTGRQAESALLDSRHRHQPQRDPARPERRLVHLGHPASARPALTTRGLGAGEMDRIAELIARGPEPGHARHHRRGRAVEGVLPAGRRPCQPCPAAGSRAAGRLPALSRASTSAEARFAR